MILCGWFFAFCVNTTRIENTALASCIYGVDFWVKVKGTRSEFQEMRRSNWGCQICQSWKLTDCFCEILSLISTWIYLESTRFVMPSSECGGRVEVKSDQGWISVCEDGFDSEAKTVACRELGCGPPQSPLRSLSNERGTTLSTQFRCKRQWVASWGLWLLNPQRLQISN